MMVELGIYKGDKKMKVYCCFVLKILISIGVGLVAYFTDCDILATGLFGASLFCLVEKIENIITPKGESSRCERGVNK